MTTTEEIRGWKDPEYRFMNQLEGDSPIPSGTPLMQDQTQFLYGGVGTPGTFTFVTAFIGCFTIGSSVCLGTCAGVTVGCC